VTESHETSHEEFNEAGEMTTDAGQKTGKQMSIAQIGELVGRLKQLAILKLVVIFCLFVVLAVIVIIVAGLGDNIDQNTQNVNANTEQVSELTDLVEELQSTAAATREDAKETRVALERALEEVNNDSASSAEFNAAIREGLEAIKRIEARLEAQGG
jgi:uncharacterized protein YoxC